MNLLEQFKIPIDKKDLIPVIKQALFMSVIGGLLIGALHLLVYQAFGYSFIWMMLFILGYFMARRIKRSYQTYHIIFAVISIIAVFFTYYLINVVYYFGFFYVVDALQIVPIVYILNPVSYFSFLNVFNSGFFGLDNILDVVFFLIVNIYVIRYIK